MLTVVGASGGGGCRGRNDDVVVMMMFVMIVVMAMTVVVVYVVMMTGVGIGGSGGADRGRDDGGGGSDGVTEGLGWRGWGVLGKKNNSCERWSEQESRWQQAVLTASTGECVDRPNGRLREDTDRSKSLQPSSSL